MTPPPPLDRFSRILFEESSEALLLAEPGDAILVDANPAAERLTGSPRGRLRGRRAAEVLLAAGAVSISDLFAVDASLPPQAGYSLRAADGSVVPVNLTVTRLPAGPAGLLWLTVRPERAAPARPADDTSRALLDSMSGAVTAVDPAGRLIYANPAFCKLVGWPADDLVGREPPFPFWAPDEAEAIGRTFRDTLAGNRPTAGHSEQYCRRDGRCFDALVRLAPLRDAGGELRGWVTTVTDTTDLRRAEAALRASEERFRSLCDCSPAGIFMTSPEGLSTWCNARLLALCGLSQDEFQGTGWLDHVYPEDRDRLLSGWQAAARAGRPHDSTFRFVRKDGAVRWLETKSSPVLAEDGRLLGHVGMVTDVTDRQAAERMRDRLAAILEATPDLVSFTDPAGKVIYQNRSARELVGDLCGKPVDAANPPWANELVREVGIPTAVREGAWSGETAVWDRHGEEVPVSQVILAHRDTGGAVEFLSTISRDLRERKHAEYALRERERFINSVVQAVPHIIYVYDRVEDRNVYVNRGITDALGYTPEEIMGLGQDVLPRLVHPEDLAHLPKLLARWDHAAEGEILESEYRLRDRWGAYRWFHARDAAFQRDPLGRVRQFIGVAEDVTDRRRSEERQRRLEAERGELLERQRLILEQMPIGCVVVDAEVRLTYLNPAAERIFGYPLAELSGRNPFEPTMAASARRQVEDVFRRLASGETSIDLFSESLTRDGRRILCQWHYRALRDREGCFASVLAMCQDVTDRRRAEDVLRESERRYRLLADHSTDMISRHDAEGRCLYVSPASARLLGYSPSELIGRPLFEFIPPGERGAVRQAYDRMTGAGNGPRTLTYPMARKDGGQVWVEATLHVLRAPDSVTPLEVHVTSRDVTERRKAEEQLRASQQRFRGLVEKSSDGIIVLDCDKVIGYASPAAGRILGYAPEELQGVPGASLVHPDDLAAARALSPDYFHQVDGALHLNLRARRRDGVWRHLETVTTNFRSDPAIDGWVVNFRDVTDRLELQEQLQQAQKMEAVGQLAGGIAHDFNNLLTAIIGNVVEVLRLTPSEAPAHELLRAADAAARRAAELTGQLLGFSRRHPLRLKPLSLKHTAEEALLILRPAIDPRISIRVDAEAGLWPVLADPTQMTSVLVNLCLNARDAMRDGGEIRVGLANVTVDEAYRRSNLGATAGDHVRLRVEDTGHGMPPEVVQRVFEPFFTTKPQGAGTGLGLAMVYGTVKAHQGWITCQSSPGEGTRFEIFLPRAEPAPAPEPAEPPAPARPGRPADGRRTILLVDDEPSIRMLARRILEMQGYHVLLAEDGLDALEKFAEMRQEIGLVILDLTMPRLSGRDTYQRLRTMEPSVRVLFSSGYSSDQLDGDEPAVGFVSKPYRPEDLARAVRQAMGDAAV